MASFVRAAAVLATALLLGACAGASPPATVRMVDAFDGDAFGAHVEELHGSYVAGAEFAVSISADGRSSEGWTLSSSDPDVIRVETPLAHGAAVVVAGKPGEATLQVVDGSGLLEAAHAVTVALPDRVGLYSPGMLLTGTSDDAAHLTQVKLVAGGDATFLVRYFRHGAELLGRPASSAKSLRVTGDLEAYPATLSLAPARDFVRLTATRAATTGSVSLVAGGAAVSEVHVSTIDRSAVAHVTVIPAGSEHAGSGVSLAMCAHAVDDTSADVYGAPIDWSIGGSRVPARSELGDVLFVAPSDRPTATVRASSVVSGAIAQPMAASPPGCAITSRAGTSGTTWVTPLGLVLLGLVCSRASRRRAA